MDRRTIRNRRLIVDTAMNLFFEQGVGSVTVEKIADRADLARATVYNHFHGLDGLITELAGPVLDSSLAAFKGMLEDGGTPPVRDILSVLFSLWTENHDTFFIMCMSDLPLAVGFGIGTPAQAARVAHVADGVIVGSALIRAVGAGCDPGEAARTFVAALRAGMDGA